MGRRTGAWCMGWIVVYAIYGDRGPILRDSYHLGQTISKDYGRPYETGFNAIAGASTVKSGGHFRCMYGASTSMLRRGRDTRLRWRRSCPSPDEIPYTGPTAGYDSCWRSSGAESVSGWWRLMFRFICWGMRFPAARRMRGWGRRMAARWHGRTMPRISIRSASTGSSR